MAITISGSGITSANIADGTITTDDILASDVKNLKSGRKNLIINGGFDVWQRGTTGTDPSNGYGTYLSADRWASYYGGTILSQQAVTIDGLPVYAMRITAGTSGNIYAYQKVERGSSIVSGKPITYSFWARANVARSQGMSGRFYDSGTQGTALNLSLSSLDITTSWQKFTQTVTLTDTALNNSRDFFINFQGTFASADWLEVANVQLELGSVATDFEHRSYGEELALCQRYYERLSYAASTDYGGGSAAELLFSNGFGYTSVRSLNNYKYQQVKRTPPTVAVSSASHIEVLDSTTGWVAASGFDSRSNIYSTRLDLTHSGGLTAGRALELRLLSGGYISIDAEL